MTAVELLSAAAAAFGTAGVLVGYLMIRIEESETRDDR